jgi:hypothetical protein
MMALLLWANLTAIALFGGLAFAAQLEALRLGEHEPAEPDRWEPDQADQDMADIVPDGTLGRAVPAPRSSGRRLPDAVGTGGSGEPRDG